MAVHLEKEIEKLKKRIILYGGMIEKNLENAIRSIQSKDGDLARQVLESDDLADQWEVENEEECLKILALHQPVAVDLRFIIAVLKINNDLERIGDEAVNIAERSLRISPLTLPGRPVDFAPLCARVQEVLRQSLDALVRLDAPLAHRVRNSDDAIDEMVHAQFTQLKDEIRKYPEQTDQLVEYLRVCRHLERIADHATNIAEDVIYMIEGSIVRHRQETK
ncbi:MAG: phosphate signaling complex protein PhoU [Acidobacteriota bacterium]|jgi:phosphate transport system protein|nr:phosphate signaling complex protein PhoU [Acidobacteriota bacterium]